MPAVATAVNAAQSKSISTYNQKCIAFTNSLFCFSLASHEAHIKKRESEKARMK